MVGQKYQSRGQGQGQGQKLMTKHGEKGGKGKNDTIEARAKISVLRARAKSRRYNRHKCEGKAQLSSCKRLWFFCKNDVDSMRVTLHLSPMQKIMSETFTFCVIYVTRMGFKVWRFKGDWSFWDILDIQRLYHLPNLLLFTFSEYTNEVTKLGRR